MSNNLFPIPAATSVMSSNTFTDVWMRYFKAIGDDLLTANRLVQTNAPKCQYTVNGNRCDMVYETSTPVETTVKLPFPPAAAFVVVTDVGSTWYPSTVKTITIPGTALYAQFWYLVKGV